MTLSPSVIKLSIKLEVCIWQDGDQWLAWCPPIDVTSQDFTKSEALASLKEAVELWFESCLDRGVLHEALTECGFQTGVLDEEHPARREQVQSVTEHDYIEVMIPAYIASLSAESRATC